MNHHDEDYIYELNAEIADLKQQLAIREKAAETDHKLIMTLTDHIAYLEKEREWHPIETVQKRGHIDGFVDGVRMPDLSWAEHEINDEGDIHKGWYNTCYYNDGFVEPTHWMPPPKPPTFKQQVESNGGRMATDEELGEI